MAYMQAYYRTHIEPLLSPMVIDQSHPFPFLLNKQVVVVALLKKGKKKTIGLIPIDPQIIPRLFDRFYRADPSRLHPQSDGAGLGLSITRAIAQAHGGRVTVESGAGRTKFSLEFPSRLL